MHQEAVATTAGDAVESRKRELVVLFHGHGALVDASLLAELAASPDGPVRVQAVLAGLKEVPFHFDAALWSRLEVQQREDAALAAVPGPVVVPELSITARKDAFGKAAASIYDAAPTGDDAADEQDDAPSDGDAMPGAVVVEAISAREEAKHLVIQPRSDWQPLAGQHTARLQVIQDMTGQSTCEGTTDDFRAYFRDRFKQISKMLRARRELRNAVPIERVKAGAQEVAIIGMVTEVFETKNGHRRISIEDETGSTVAFVKNDDPPLLAMAQNLLPDEVIGVVGQVSTKGDVVWCNAILRPDIPIPQGNEKKGAEVPLAAAFLSDIHVGSKTFLSENWATMLKWLRGGGATKRERDMAGRIKYVVIPGDLVDGVGIFPNQETELSIGDIYEQYGAFGDWIGHLPDHVEVVVQPGNHDAVRPAEPQPAFTKEVRTRFDHHGTHFIANPAMFRMHGVSTLGYHGFSLIDFARTCTDLEYAKPLDTMQRMLECRHLSPKYGDLTPVAPEHHDYMVISEVPDLFVTGHVHIPGLRNYRGVLNINCGTWQSQTGYQKKLNFVPDPARMPLVDLQTLRGTLVDFQSPATQGAMAAQA